ncbi:hypothetical protein EPO05_00485 [Patescibacteria group bacterium]|nr:MAG: hypothetical protein EPO05_00485 [Patescibacteria group bacterium]
MESTYKYVKVWRRRNPDKRKAQRQRYYDQTKANGKGKHMKHWKKEELLLVLKKNGQSDQALSKLLGRSVQSIQAARLRWKNRIGAIQDR